MKKLSATQMQELLEAGAERRSLEFKSPFAWESKAPWIQECVIRAILAMTNTLYGGRIIIGIEEKPNSSGEKELIFSGVTDDQLKSFENYEKIKGVVDGFSTIDTSFDIDFGEHNGAKYVVITVQEFYDVPALCKKNGSHTGVLVQNDMYSRSKRGAYSSSKVTELELREILHMAADKEKEELKARKFVKLSPEQKTNYDDQVKDIL